MTGRRIVARSFAAVLTFKMLYLMAQHGLSFEQTEHLVRDRLSWMRFCGLSIADLVPDANTLWDFREALIRAGAFDQLFERLDRSIKNAGYLPMSGQIVDASLVAAPPQRNTDEEKAAIKAGGTAAEIWLDKPAKAAQQDTDARWTVKTSKGKVEADGTIRRDLAIPEFCYKSHISIDKRHGFVRWQQVTAAARGGARLRQGLIDPTNTASDVWADTPAGRRRTKNSWLIAANAARFTVANPPASRCRSARPRRTSGNSRCGRTSSTSSPSRSSG